MPTTKRACAYLLIATLGFAALACGDDDSAASDGTSGKSGSSGSSGKSGSTATSGKGGSSGGSAGSSSSNGTGKITADDALAGACVMMDMMGGTATSMCTGIDEYTQCAQDSCKLNDCLSNTSCKEYVSCINSADDACNNSCALSMECSSCLLTAEMCAGSMCLSKIQCGTLTKGGACDKLDTCCGTLDANMKMTCTMASTTIRVGGDDACMQLLGAFCPMMM